MYKRLVLFFIFVPLLSGANDSIKNISGSFSIETLHSSGSDMPFWLVHNRRGRYPVQGSSMQVASLSGLYDNENIFSSRFRGQFGFDFIGAWSDRFETHFNRLFLNLSSGALKIEAGWFFDDDNFRGLSTTNGHIDRSLNARPYPKVRLGTNGFVPFFFFRERFSFKAEYDDGWLGKKRYVKNARLHHKSLYGRFKLSQSVRWTIGMNHFVYWGGVSPTKGELPDDFHAYWLYITGRSGSEDFISGDQLNVAGNQLGSYYMELGLKKEQYNLTFYLSHPFDDHSGMEFDNRRDNLLGVFMDFREKRFINQILYEFMYTIHQSGHIHEYGVMRGRDNYFNHGVYRSGHTYMNYAMGSPLFSPLMFSDGIVTSIENNRLLMHHIGLNGYVFKHFGWKGMMTFTKNRGTYGNVYDTERKQLSALLTLNYVNESFPVDISLSVSGDMGKHYPGRAGGLVKISKIF